MALAAENVDLWNKLGMNS